jgi:hypothetical protein
MKKFFGALIAMCVMLSIANVVFADNLFNWGQNRNAPAVNATAVKLISADYTATGADQLIKADAISSAITVTLPPVYNTTGLAGKTYVVQKTDTSANAVTVVASVSDIVANTIEGSASRKILITGKMFLSLKQGPDWKVSWETPPVQVDMYTGVVTVATATAAFSGLTAISAATGTFTNLSATTLAATTGTITNISSSGAITGGTLASAGTVSVSSVACWKADGKTLGWVSVLTAATGTATCN